MKKKLGSASASHTKPVRVELDPDVAKVFGTSESVNLVLRGIIQGLSSAKKQKKTA